MSGPRQVGSRLSFLDPLERALTMIDCRRVRGGERVSVIATASMLTHSGDRQGYAERRKTGA
jgi:hypothetical protein